jgi:hypothetical protein
MKKFLFGLFFIPLVLQAGTGVQPSRTEKSAFTPSTITGQALWITQTVTSGQTSLFLSISGTVSVPYAFAIEATSNTSTANYCYFIGGGLFPAEFYLTVDVVATNAKWIILAPSSNLNIVNYLNNH